MSYRKVHFSRRNIANQNSLKIPRRRWPQLPLSEKKQKQPKRTSVALLSCVPMGTPTVLQRSKTSSPVFLPAIVNLMATSKPAGLIQAYIPQLPPRQQVLVKEYNEEHLNRFQIQATEGKNWLSPEVLIKKIFQKLRSILASKKRHHTLQIVLQKLRVWYGTSAWRSSNREE